jgi:hypothetical protein
MMLISIASMFLNFGLVSDPVSSVGKNMDGDQRDECLDDGSGFGV